MKHTAHPSQRGAALLAAMLTVALVATFAAGALWQQWKSIEVEGAERQRTQARWLLIGALDWARVILREDARAGNASAPSDHLAEPWAVPLQEARLSSFLSALPDGTGASVDETKLAQQVLLSGQISDLQGRLNVTNLLQGEQLDAATVIAFQRLFDVLGLPPAQLSLLTQGLAAAQRKNEASPLMPQRISQLTWFGLTPQTLNILSPHITLLPTRTPINVNTASIQVLYASVPGMSLSDAQRLVQQRERQHWATLDAFQKALGRSINLSDAFSVSTKFFEVTGRLRMPQTMLQERSLVQREMQDLKVLWRESGSLQ
ncbi:MAG: general secretion pathway protein GspK [Burkholderiales bacterium 35-55-47]|jgi:general secretion pathway protein K|uniref:type II secretion system minor pseudopilin GspK n=1 Tax=Limnohabitans sp. TaxID=1907725 RepID=UPI000BCBC266|nr:type II secretion system minor pseudopilin GspK [Limnohabitans sp.]OYY17622.1 MAG: general secretion pathway protein GspK [Burkholderiales bacterium 35-55-47]OYZ72003.1 MAG: general secretion pathway protein GspK [Burkholderiales bacterium 24-55-52]OZA99014.1 MAG: general secretion pathway protein GspK [Burkholderiales bacterium 39-55-53]HQR86924.1 type II secretion system minor pseudopilin GspK [Limnohabitans sp.]HQS26978.1 type II secretion system minor pseudopilin GspK [Limnohabitans sp.